MKVISLLPITVALAYDWMGVDEASQGHWVMALFCLVIMCALALVTVFCWGE